jgi:hypothetical protein
MNKFMTTYKYLKLTFTSSILCLNIKPLLSQSKLRSDYKNEAFISIQLNDNFFKVYGIGYERTVFIKGIHFFSLQNEYTTSIMPRTADDGQRLNTLIKWNKQQRNILTLGLGTSYRINTKVDKLSLLFNSSYKYSFVKPKITLSGNIFMFLLRSQPATQGLQAICKGNCPPQWSMDWRFGVSLGKYF